MTLRNRANGIHCTWSVYINTFSWYFWISTLQLVSYVILCLCEWAYVCVMVDKHLAGGQHVGDGFAAQVGSGYYVLLLSRVACCHCFGCCNGDALGHADELFRGGRFLRNVLGMENLESR